MDVPTRYGALRLTIDEHGNSAVFVIGGDASIPVNQRRYIEIEGVRYTEVRCTVERNTFTRDGSWHTKPNYYGSLLLRKTQTNGSADDRHRQLLTTEINRVITDLVTHLDEFAWAEQHALARERDRAQTMHDRAVCDLASINERLTVLDSLTTMDPPAAGPGALGELLADSLGF